MAAWIGDRVEGLWKRGPTGVLAPPCILVGVLARERDTSPGPDFPLVACP